MLASTGRPKVWGMVSENTFTKYVKAIIVYAYMRMQVCMHMVAKYSNKVYNFVFACKYTLMKVCVSMVSADIANIKHKQFAYLRVCMCVCRHTHA